MIKVMIVDDQALLKQTLIFMLGQDSELEVIDGGENGYQAIKRCQEYEPDVILMDLSMPQLGGIEAMKQIKQQYAKIKIVILTTFEDDKSIFSSIINGADGYIVKDIKPEELVMAVKSVYSNLYVMHENVLALLKEEVIRISNNQEHYLEVVEEYDLSPVELKIIREMVNGKNNRQIAERLGFTEGTIKNKVSKILTKLELKDRTQIAVFAIKNNII